MKMIFRLVLPILILSTMTASCATSVRVAPTKGIVVTKLHHPKVIVHKNVRYYRSKGVWYVKKNKRFIIVKAPIGIKIATLPKGYKVVKIRGARYYKCNGVFYRKSGRKYIVVHV